MNGSEHGRGPGQGQTDLSVMVAGVVAMCVGVFVLAALIPVLGLPAGLVVALLAGAVLIIGHRKLMGGGC